MSGNCPKCGVANPKKNKFCGHCGCSLASGGERFADERKIVTVLFADITDFTALSERMDPEEVRDTIRDLFSRFTATIKRYDGTVDKFIGDCVMALFGAPVAHENDPERAVRAALSIQEDIESFRRERGMALGLRIGINTGRVLAGYIGAEEGGYTVIGDDVNIAARLEQAAPPNGILIGAKTQRHVHDLFEFERLEPLFVKGKTEPLEVYRVLSGRKKAKVHERALPAEAPMVGRDAELERMRRAAQESWKEGRHQVVLVTSPPGLGKSRMLTEFERALPGLGVKPQVFRGRALPYASNIPYFLFADLLKEKCGILDDDKAADVRMKLVAGVRQVMSSVPEAEAEEAAHLMGSLIHIDFPESPHVAPYLKDPVLLHQRARQAFLDFFKAAAAGPAIVYLEDLHWAEQSSIDLAVDLFQEARARPLAVVAAARPEFFERFPDAAWVFSSGEMVRLEQLAPDSVRALVRALIKQEAPPNLVRLVIEKSAGNPYFVQELVRMVVEKGLLRKGSAIDAESLAIPDSVQGLLQARVDNLSSLEKETLQRGAIVGSTFWKGAVDVLLEDVPGDSTGALLKELVRKDFIQAEQESSFLGDAYSFRHALLRDVAYETILKKRRMRYHALLAEWLEKNTGDRRAEFLPLLALHFELGGLAEKARTYYFQAGERARSTNANKEAVDYFGRAIALTDKPAFEYHGRRGLTLELLGDYAAALSDYGAALAAAESDKERGSALKHLAEIHLRMGHYDEARGYVDKAAALGRKVDDPKLIADALNIRARIHDFTGEADLALKYYVESMQLHRKNGDALGEATALGNVGVVRLYRGEYDKAVTAYEAALRLDRSQDDKRRMTIMTSNLGEAYLLLGDLSKADAYCRESLGLARAMGFKMMVVDILRNLGNVCVLRLQFDEGLALLRESLNLAEGLQDMELLPQVLNSLGRGLFLSGRRDEALKAAERLLELVEKRGDKHFIASGLLLKGLLLPLSEARRALEAGLKVAQELGAPFLLWEFHKALSAASADPKASWEHIRAAKENVDVVAGAIEEPLLRKTFLASSQIAPIVDMYERLRGLQAVTQP